MTVLVVHVGVVLLLALAALLLRRRPEAAHLLWVLVFVKLLVPPFLEVAVLPGVEHGAVVREFDPGLAMTSPATGGPQLVSPVVPINGERSDGVAVAVATAPTDWWGLALAAAIPVWLAGCVGFFAWTAWSLWRFRRWLRAGKAPSQALDSRIRRLASAVGLRRAPRCQVIDAAISPAVMPGFVPLLLLPRALVDDLEDEALDSVIVHELVHLLHRDHLVRCLELVVLAVHWWCPPVWWFRRWLRATEEASCDRRVLRLLPGRAKAYATALIEAAAVLGRARPNVMPRLATAMGAGHPLTERLEMIMKYRSTPPLARGLRLALLAPVLGLVPLLPVPAASQVAQSKPEGVEVEPPVVEAADPLDLAAIEASLRVQDPVRKPPGRGFEPEMNAIERDWLREYLQRSERGEPVAARKWLAARRTDDSTAAFDFALASMHVGADEFEIARGILDAAVQKSPEFARAWRLLGITNFRLGRHEAARTALRRVVDLGVADGTTYGLLANAAFALGDYTKAETAYWLANLRQPESRDWKMGLIQVFFATRRYAEAIELADRVLADRELAESDPAPRILRVKANALLALGRGAEAADCLLTLAPAARQADDMLLVGDLLTEGQPDRAVAAYLEALKLAPNANRDRFLRAAKVLQATGNAEQGAALLAALKAIDPAAIDVQRAAAQAILRSDAKLEERVRAATELVALEPDNGEALLVLGRLHAEAGRVKSAARYFERASKFEPHRRDAFLRYAQLLVELGRYDEAIERLERAQAIDSTKQVGDFLRAVRRVAGSAEVFELAKVDEEPKLSHSVAPAVPAGLRKHQPATVRVRFEITPRGRVRGAEIVASSDARFDEHALEAIREFRYEPARKAGKAVAVRMELPIRFAATKPKKAGAGRGRRRDF